MATSGTFENAVSNAADWLYVGLNWSLLSQSATDGAHGSSKVKFQVYLRTGEGTISTSIKRNIVLSLAITNAPNMEFTGSADLTMGRNTTKVIFEKTADIPHYSDDKGVAVTFGVTVNIGIMTTSLKWVEEGYIRDRFGLPNIKVPSTFAVAGSGEMGTAHAITISRNNSEFTHTLKYRFGGAAGTIATGVGTSYTWTPPRSLAEKIPSATSSTCTLTLETYVGSTFIGSSQESFIMYVPKDALPTVSGFSLTEAVEGLAEQFGAFVSTKSKIAFNVKASGSLGSTISTYQVYIAGQNFARSSGTTPVISAGGDLYTATATVTDSRGRKASMSVNFTVIDYVPPTFYDFSVHRCDPDGVYNEQGECLTIDTEFKTTSAGGKNPLSYAISYKLLDADDKDYAPLPFDFTGHEFNDTLFFAEPTFSSNHTYSIRVQLTDYFGTVTKVQLLSSSRPVFDIMYSGAGFAFNKMAEVPDVLDIGYATRFFGGIRSMVLQEGTDLNTVMTTGYYASVNMAAKDYINCPLTGGTFTLEVLEAGAESQLMQRLTYASKDTPTVFVRHYYGSAWGEWVATYGQGVKVLWTGTAKWMNAEQTVPLEEPISLQPNGIVMVFTYYEGKAQNTDMNHIFVSKQSVAYAEGELRPFMMATGDGAIGIKQLHISDQYIEGHTQNGQTYTGESGLTIANTKFALAAVLGV